MREPWAESLKTQLSRLGELGSRLLLAEGQQQVDTDMNRHFDSEKDREKRWVTFFFHTASFPLFMLGTNAAKCLSTCGWLEAYLKPHFFCNCLGQFALTSVLIA